MVSTSLSQEEKASRSKDGSLPEQAVMSPRLRNVEKTMGLRMVPLRLRVLAPLLGIDRAR
jgi:hypothetical protein